MWVCILALRYYTGDMIKAATNRIQQVLLNAQGVLGSD